MFPKPSADVLDSILQTCSAISLLGVHEHRELLGLLLRHQIDSADRDCSNMIVPLVLLGKELKTRICNLVGELRSKRELALELSTVQIVRADVDLYAVGHQLMNTQPMSNVLAKF